MPTEGYVDPVERSIRDAIDRGEFENLPGAGKPLPDVDKQYDEGWWAKKFVDRAQLEDAADELRRTISKETPLLRTMSDRQAAAARAAELNARVEELNRRLPETEHLTPIALPD